MKKVNHIYFILSLFLGQFLISCSDNSSNVNFPTHIFLSKPSPNKNTTAIIYSWVEKNKLDFGDNWLGSDSRFILGFTNKKAKWYVDFELSEGLGTYEGGVMGIEWLNENEVLIRRRISDSQKDIKFNLELHEWTLLQTL